MTAWVIGLPAVFEGSQEWNKREQGRGYLGAPQAPDGGGEESEAHFESIVAQTLHRFAGGDALEVT